MRKTLVKSASALLVVILICSESIAQTAYFDNEKKLYGITNAFGKDILKPSFTDMRAFQNGLSLFEKDGKWGLIDDKGKIILKPSFATEDECAKASESYFTTAKNKSTDNSKLVPFQNQKTGLYGYKDNSGKIVIEAQYNYAFKFSEALALVQKKKSYFFIDESGAEVIQVNPQWSWIEGTGGIFQNGLFEFRVNDNPQFYVLINNKGDIIKKMNQGVFPTFINR